jgi:fumarate hydratase subunit beta
MAEHHLGLPLDERTVRGLAMGDTVYLTGTFVTARDEAHIHALHMRKEGRALPFEFENSAVFHCGPIARETSEGRWEIVAAGPTTSTRMNSLEPEFLRTFKARAIIGKGGMSRPTVEAMKEVGAVYLAITGGAAVVAARGIAEVKAVHWLEELGMPEALWVLEGRDFGPTTVGIDAHGNSIFERVDAQVRENVGRIKAQLGIQ